MVGKGVAVSSEAEDQILCDPVVSLLDLYHRVAVPQTFSSHCTLLEIVKKSKSFCLYGSYLLIFTILKIEKFKNIYLLKNPCMLM